MGTGAAASGALGASRLQGGLGPRSCARELITGLLSLPVLLSNPGPTAPGLAPFTHPTPSRLLCLPRSFGYRDTQPHRFRNR